MSDKNSDDDKDYDLSNLSSKKKLAEVEQELRQKAIATIKKKRGTY